MPTILNKINKENGVPVNKIDFDIIDNNMLQTENHINDLMSHLTQEDKINYADKYTKAEVDNKLNQISNETIPIATETNNGIMTSDMVKQVDKIGDLTTSLSQKANKANVLPYTDLSATATDLNTLVISGLYKCNLFTNYPSGNPDGQGLVEVRQYNTGWEKQIFISPSLDAIWERSRINSVWGTWKQLATTETTYATLLNGWVNQIGDLKVSRNGNQVTVNLTLGNGATTNNSSFANLPIGFRPSVTRYVNGTVWNSSWTAYSIDILITTDGNMSFSGTPLGNSRLVCNIAFTM